MTTRNRLQKKLITEGSIYRSINRSKTFEENLSSLMLLLWKKRRFEDRKQPYCDF